MWIERLLFAGSLLILLTAVAILGVNSSGLPARWAEEALVGAFPGVGAELGSVRFTGPGSLEASALRLDLDGDGNPDVRSEAVSIRFNLLRWIRDRDPVAATHAVVVRGVHARLLLPEGEPPAPKTAGARQAPDPAGETPSEQARVLLARLPQGVHLRVEEAEVTLADAAGEIARLSGRAEAVRAATPGRNALELRLAVEEEAGARLGVEAQVPLDRAGLWAGEVHATGDLSAPWITRLLQRVDGWPQAIQLAGPVGLDGTLAGHGEWPRLRMEVRGAPVTVDARAAGWPRYRFDTLSGWMTWEEGGLRLEPLRLDDGRAVLTASGRISAEGPAVDLQGERLPLERYLPFVAGFLKGEAALEGRMSGSWADLTLAGSVTAPHPTLLGGEVDRLRAELAWTQGRLQVSQGVVELGEGRLEGAGWWRPGDAPGGTLQADLRSKGFPLQALQAARVLGLGGQADGEVHLEGAPRDPSISGRASSARLVMGPARFDQVEGAFSGSWNRLHLEQLTARRVEGGRYRVTGWMGPGVDGAVAGEGPGLDLEVEVTDESLPAVAALLGYKLPSYLLTGRFDGRAEVGGNQSNPTGSARLELKEGPIMGQELVTQLDLRFGNGAVRVERLRRHPLRTGLDTWVPS
ncbi:translocation/assembly module TamB domain-containing protein [Limnochorda pilosa]|uniref:Dicarboxylate transport domain-containing protein n=1 Tax=Limnochorda pilosa TaxID=1555112 RepID=A0A0K2SP98_LIMPI|nr:hypothetical protein [Limnochorda pilosa]BAS28963.1 hypothetical protein LIP_3135 [Limnochorda pilosa]